MRIVYGGEDAFNALAFGAQNPNNQKFFQQQLASVANITGDITNSFYQRAQQLYHSVYNEQSINFAKAALNQVRGIFQPDVIRPLVDIENLQIAGSQMQRWVMTNPAVREVYHNQRCDGYSDSYIDQEPGKIGWEHYDYRRVMNGIAQVEPDGPLFTHVYEQLKPGDTELDFTDQVSILQTWGALEHFMRAAHKDPTSPWNNDL